MRTYTPLPGSDKSPLTYSRAAGPVNPSEITSLTIRVRPKADAEALNKLAYELAAQPVAQRTYLTHAQLEEMHGADPKDLDAIEHYARQHDLAVVHRSAAERVVVVKGSLGNLLAAFRADVHTYHHAGGTYRGRRGQIQVPQELSGIVTGVFGFDTRPKHRAPHSQKGLLAHAGPGGANGVLATEFATRYKFPQGDGAGQTIAIIELGGGFRHTDLAMFFKEAGIPLPKVSSVSVDHAGNSPSTPDSADGEVMLDVEVAGAVAPKAKIVVYFAPNVGDKGFLDAISAAVHDAQRKPSVISISWGGPETSTDKQGIAAYHELFAAAAALGITVCAASGDHGAADLDVTQWDGKIHVDHPACDDLVLGCGGTQIDPKTSHDVVWNEGTPFDENSQDGGGWASGGGISKVFTTPAYQHGIKLVSVDGHTTGRGVPDIAMSATNYFTRVDTAEGASGGTSAVAPLMAGLVARLAQAKKKNIGFLNPFLYKNATTVMTDVVTGSNVFGKVAGYKAQKGWDACTGLGTPDGSKILAHIDF